eukprot:scaffold5340_cov131-Isochrysis_galbana.AAC.4
MAVWECERVGSGSGSGESDGRAQSGVVKNSKSERSRRRPAVGLLPLLRCDYARCPSRLGARASGGLVASGLTAASSRRRDCFHASIQRVLPNQYSTRQSAGHYPSLPDPLPVSPPQTKA